ncbi:MAG: choice-of-anchor D domain-containing protein [Candidatus Kapabacteria bacterium]|nr:choice-of-anchor D domain-containing protein [Candidatus Kapabacteria bacterium]
MKLQRLILVLAALVVGIAQSSAQFPASCDGRKDCIFNAVQFTTTSGRSQHFIELQKNPVKARQTAVTFEMWAKIEKQANQRQFVGGLWGPNSDFNDVFVAYIDTDDDLVFEINGDVGQLKGVDNTIARTSAASLYGAWHHVAFVFDGAQQSAYIYIDGLLAVGPVRNSQYPTSYLKNLDRPDLPFLIGSCNGVADNQNTYRTLKGLVDEIRIWDRALDSTTIMCQKDRSLNGNESGLRAYLRCNEGVGNISTMCDATGNAHTGLLRSGASNQRSDRTVGRTLTVSPSSVKEDILCDTVKQWQFTLTDAAICGSTANLVMRGPDASLFTISPTSVNLTGGIPQVVTVTFRGTLVGTFIDTLEIRPTNRCGLPNIQVRMELNRITETGINRRGILFDTLWVGCVDNTQFDSTIIVCNTSDVLGRPRVLTIQRTWTTEPKGFALVGVTYPIRLQPGQCTTLVVRSYVRDTTADYKDTLRIVTDDQCQKTPITVELMGRTQEVIAIRNTAGSRRIDTMRFEPTCPGLLSNPQNYTWQNLTLSNLVIDTIIVPKDFTHYRIRFPFTLLPKTGYPFNSVRFLPRQPGTVFDSIIIKTQIQGCKIEKKIYVTGRGLDNKVQWSVNGLVDFGDVLVGQQKTINVRAKNNSKIDALTVALYVERGESFALLGGTSRTINPGDSTTIPITFRPTDSLNYIDRLCLFETRCYVTDCIDLKGRGRMEIFRFQPLVMETQNVISCQAREDSVFIINATNSPRRIDSLQFVDQSGGRIAIIDPPTSINGTALTIPARDSARFRTRYTPADPTRDRADRAYIRFRDESRAEWQVQLIATSVAPKLYISQNTAFGTVEVGDTKRMQMIVENTSSLPVRVDSLTISAGFRIISTSRVVPLTLAPRDSIRVEVEFAPDAAKGYSGALTAYSSDPCVITGTGPLTGRGIIVKLESALSLVNFGYVRPCECVERSIELLNGSLKFDMSVEKLWIDSAGVPGGKPQFYSWKSKFSPNGTVPYTVPPGERDTVLLTFCPRTPADAALMECRAALHIKASGSQWSNTLETFLVGKRSLTFRPAPTAVQFPYGVVDVLSPQILTTVLKIPDYRLNPSQDIVTVDSVTFLPDDRIFTVSAPTTWPQVIKPGDSLVVQLRQRPRAPRDYRTRLKFWFSSPCTGWDTTVLVRGGGFAQTKGLQFAFDLMRPIPDTFKMVSCDTLNVPLYSSIKIDASVVNIGMRVDFDSTQLRLLDVTSTLLANQCTSQTGGVKFTPSLSFAPSPYGGQSVSLKNFCGVDSLKSFAVLRFVTLNNNRANSRLTIDSISFDTEDVILYRLIAAGDKGTIIAAKSDIMIKAPTDFDSVRILECADRTITVTNTGDVYNAVTQLLDLPASTTIVGSVPPMGDSIAPGDSAVFTLRYCPRKEQRDTSTPRAVSGYPCDVRDTSFAEGWGYAPEFDLSLLPTPTFFVSSPFKGAIGDTIQVPVMIDKDISATYNGVTYFLNGLNFDATVTYEPRSLKYIGIASQAKPNNTTVLPTLGQIGVEVRGADTLRAGPLLTLQFVMTAPELSSTSISVSSNGYTSDSLQFLDVAPKSGSSPVESSGKCNITVVKFAPGGKARVEIFPQPAVSEALVSFRMQETVPVFIDVVDARGTVVRTVLDGSVTLSGGEYSLRFDTADLSSGVYMLRISAGVFNSSVPLVIAK